MGIGHLPPVIADINNLGRVVVILIADIGLHCLEVEGGTALRIFKELSAHDRIVSIAEQTLIGHQGILGISALVP